MLTLFDRLKTFLPLRALRCEASLADAGVDADGVAARIVRSELFCHLEPELICSLLEAMDVVRVRAGAHIMKQGRRGDSYLVLARGSAVVTSMGSGREARCVLAELNEPTGLGEEALLGAGARMVTVTMQTNGIVLRIKRDAFASFVGRHFIPWELPETVLGAAASDGGSVRIWVAQGGRGQAVGEGVLVIPLNQLRGRLSELDPSKTYYCCCRDGKDSALAAFLLMQRGFKASAVRVGLRG
jgi:CRP-like cAMP-binding protein